MKEKTCAFCYENDQSRVLYTGLYAKVIFSNPRLTKGHLLVIPIRHVEAPWELLEKENREIQKLIKKFQKLLSETIGTGCDLRENYRPFLQDSRLKKDHLHYHLIPRTLNDDIYEKTQKDEAAHFKDLTLQEIADVEEALII